MKSYIVIGLGLFGTEMAVKLYDCGEVRTIRRLDFLKI